MFVIEKGIENGEITKGFLKKVISMKLGLKIELGEAFCVITVKSKQ